MHNIQRYGMAMVMTYEVVALMTRDNRRVPTITHLQSQRHCHAIGAALVVYLAVHFYRANQS